VPIAQGGTNVTLLDLSSDMIDMAVSLGTGRKVELESLHMDMRDLSIEAEYDCARCGGGTFGYFSDAENLITLSRMAHAVKLGGRVLIDVLNRDRVIQDLPNRGWWEGDGCLIQEDADFDLMTSRLEVKRLLVFSDGTQREALISIRLYSIHELGQMMEFVGLRPLDVTGAPQTEGTFFVTQSQRLMVTGERVR
jgi:SAM-dependent methyltransferase